MPVVPYNIASAPVIAVCSTAEFRSLIKCRVVFGALHGSTCDLIKKMGVKTSLLGVTNGEPSATSEVLGIKLTSPRTGVVSEGWFPRVAPDPRRLSSPPPP